jgi:RHS repeat-associated protein
VRLVVNVMDGTVVQRLVYDEFGLEVENTNPGFQTFGYAGGLRDGHTMFIRFGMRDYNASSGRWTTRDPIGLAGGAGNVYTYALNNPVGLNDPSGLSPCRLSTPAGDFLVDQDIAQRAQNFLIAAVALGYEGEVTSGLRTTQRQRELYNARRPGDRVARPGTSPHEAGFALDLSWEYQSCESRRAPLDAARGFGFRQSYPTDDPVHFFSGTYGRYGEKATAIRENQGTLRQLRDSGRQPSACELVPPSGT